MRNDLAIKTICEYINTEINDRDKGLRNNLLKVVGHLCLKDYQTEEVKCPEDFTEKVMKKVKESK